MSRSVGFIGLGIMGRAMARRLVDAKHRVTVYNRDASKAAELVAAGATRAETPRRKPTRRMAAAMPFHGRQIAPPCFRQAALQPARTQSLSPERSRPVA